MRSTPRSTTRTRERRCLGCARLAADAYANFDRDVERLHGDDPAVDPLGGVLPQPCGFPLTLVRSEEHTSELQSRLHLVCRLLLEKKKKKKTKIYKRQKKKEKKNTH